MIPEKIRSMRRSLVRNNLVTTLCLVLVLVCFLLNYLERREERLERMRYAYYVAADGEVIPAQYAQRRDNIEVEIRHHLAMFVEDWYTLTQYDWGAQGRGCGMARRQQPPRCVHRTQTFGIFQPVHPEQCHADGFGCGSGDYTESGRQLRVRTRRGPPRACGCL